MRSQVRNIALYVKSVLVGLLLMTQVCSCDVHEWPEVRETVPVYVDLKFNTDMPMWVQDSVVASTGVRGTLDHGVMRYIVRAYAVQDQRVIPTCVAEEITTRDMAMGYDCGVTLNLEPGDYSIMVWADMTENSSQTPYYNADDFSEIKLQGSKHYGSIDYRDAFRGKNNIVLVSDIYDRAPDTCRVVMERPLAKFEFVAKDLAQFVDKEISRLKTEALAQGNTNADPNVDLNTYKIKIQYIGFMSSTYNMFTDERTSSQEEVVFDGKVRLIDENTASIGFDYIFVNEVRTTAWVRIRMYTEDDVQVGYTDQIKIPLRRNHHTLIKGVSLVSESEGGVQIDPGFDNDHNLVFGTD